MVWIILFVCWNLLIAACLGNLHRRLRRIEKALMAAFFASIATQIKKEDKCQS